MKARWYVRCTGCLGVAAVECDADFHDPKVKGVTCSACGSTLEVLGKVDQDAMLTDVEERCPCDERCTCAMGPHCNCKCGGKNPGTGKVVEIRIIKEAPVLIMPESEKARERVAEFRALAAKVESFLPTAPGRAEYEARKAGRWLNADAYAEMAKYVYLLNAIEHAEHLKTHSGRMRALEKLLP